MMSFYKVGSTKILPAILVLFLLLNVACATDAPPEMPPDSGNAEAIVAATPRATSRVDELPATTMTLFLTPTVITTVVSAETVIPATQTPFALCAGGELAAETPFPTELTAQIDPIIDQLQARSPQAGVSVAIQCGSGPLFVRAYGGASMEAGVPAQPDTVYSLASLTKQYTAAAVLQLVEQGLIDLDAPVSRYLPDWQQPGVTVRQLLNHTGGVFSYTRLYGPNVDLSAETTPDTLIDLFADAPLDFPPGTQFSYSDSGYVLLGKLIETVSGQSYPDYMRQYVLDPAGLNDTVYCVPTPAGIAQPYELRSNVLQPVALINFSHAYSAGGLCGTVADVVRWQKALHSGVVIAPAALQAMTTSGVLADGSPTGYGFGLFIENDNGRRLLGHNGVAPGFSAWSSYYPDDDLSVVLLANTVPGAFLLQDAATAIAQALFTIR